MVKVRSVDITWIRLECAPMQRGREVEGEGGREEGREEGGGGGGGGGGRGNLSLLVLLG